MAFVEASDRALLDKAHPCHGNSLWRPGPEGGASQMFLCDECGAEFVVHPGRVVYIGKWVGWKPYRDRKVK
jgi:hypothetical protein